jgi:hypothetical protein
VFNITTTVQEADLSAVLRMQGARTRIVDGWIKRIQHRWNHRHWRRNSRRSMARLWYAATLAGQAQSKARKSLETVADTSRELGVPFFAMTQAQLEDEIAAFQAPRFQDAVEHASRTIDSHELVVATVAASGVGIAIGALITALVH